MRRKWVLFGSSLFAIFYAIVSDAKSVVLYEQPSLQSKQVGTIDTEKGFVPIFSKKEGDWVKVGDPTNGNTGWVQANDLAKVAASPQGYSFSQSMMTTNKGPQSWIVKLGPPTVMNVEQSSSVDWKQMMAEQDAMQREMEKMMQEMFHHPDWIHFPMIMPVMMVPVVVQPTQEKSVHK